MKTLCVQRQSMSAATPSSHPDVMSNPLQRTAICLDEFCNPQTKTQRLSEHHARKRRQSQGKLGFRIARDTTIRRCGRLRSGDRIRLVGGPR
jgi:hypothetical protein